MNQRSMLLVVGLLGGCVADAGTDDVETLSEPLTQAISVGVGDPIQMVPAPYVLVDAAVGDVLNFSAVTPTCPTTCSLTWRDPDHGIPRYGGVILGYGPTLSRTATTAGSSRVSLEYCQKTSVRFSRCITTMVYITTH